MNRGSYTPWKVFVDEALLCTRYTGEFFAAVTTAPFRVEVIS